MRGTSRILLRPTFVHFICQCYFIPLASNFDATSFADDTLLTLRDKNFKELEKS